MYDFHTARPPNIDYLLEMLPRYKGREEEKSTQRECLSRGEEVKEKRKSRRGKGSGREERGRGEEERREGNISSIQLFFLSDYNPVPFLFVLPCMLIQEKLM